MAQNFLVSTHTQSTSTTTADVKSVTPPAYGARGVTLGAQSQDAYVSFDGTDPSSAHGLRIIAGAQPVTLPFTPTSGNVLKIASQTASSSVVDIVWLY